MVVDSNMKSQKRSSSATFGFFLHPKSPEARSGRQAPRRTSPAMKLRVGKPHREIGDLEGGDRDEEAEGAGKGKGEEERPTQPDMAPRLPDITPLEMLKIDSSINCNMSSTTSCLDNPLHMFTAPATAGSNPSNTPSTGASPIQPFSLQNMSIVESDEETNRLRSPGTESMRNRGRYSYASPGSSPATPRTPRKMRRRKDPTPYK